MQDKQPLKDIIVVATGLGSFVIFWLLTIYIESLLNDFQEEWIINLIISSFGYLNIILPTYIVYKYVHWSNYFQSEEGQTKIGCLLEHCYLGNRQEDTLEDSLIRAQSFKSKNKISQQPPNENRLLKCAFGTLIFLLVQASLQEKIMTTKYSDSNGIFSSFKNSQFLVFFNRMISFIFAFAYISMNNVPKQNAPLYKYSFSSLSNILSSWCQYEALRFVSFPTQVMAKSYKSIPVMLFGWIVNRKKYKIQDYVFVFVMSLGMMIFLMGNIDHEKESSKTTLIGSILLLGYIVSDSFTSNWQKRLMEEYGTGHVTTMYNENMVACILTIVPLMHQGNLTSGLSFMLQFKRFAFDCIVLSICSALGKHFIYKTLEEFDPLTLSIIMAMKQMLSVIFSYWKYGHEITFDSGLGLSIVFLALIIKAIHKKFSIPYLTTPKDVKIKSSEK